MTTTRAIMCTLLGVMLLGVSAPAWSLELPGDDPYRRKTGAIKVMGGEQFALNSDFAEFWEMDPDSTNFAVAYERRVTRSMGIEALLGYSDGGGTGEDLFIVDDSMDAKFQSFYTGITGMLHPPAVGRFSFYGGGGPIIYFTEAEYHYRNPTLTIDADDDFVTVGAQAVAGMEIVLIKHPVSGGSFDAPLGLSVEYRGTWVKAEDADEAVISEINNTFGGSYSNHEAHLGGHGIFVALTWHF
jgi:hypothetical protein